jgi:hypothetical protein
VEYVVYTERTEMDDLRQKRPWGKVVIASGAVTEGSHGQTHDSVSSRFALHGWVGAFRLDTGAPVWRFNTFPARDEPGAETWSATEVLTAGGAVWTPFSLTWLSPREPLRDSGGFLPQSQPLRSSPCPRSRTSGSLR